MKLFLLSLFFTTTVSATSAGSPTAALRKRTASVLGEDQQFCEENCQSKAQVCTRDCATGRCLKLAMRGLSFLDEEEQNEMVEMCNKRSETCQIYCLPTHGPDCKSNCCATQCEDVIRTCKAECRARAINAEFDTSSMQENPLGVFA